MTSMNYYRRKPLCQAGVAHLFVVLGIMVFVGVVGVFALVASSAKQLSSSQASATSTLAAKINQDTSNKGTLLLYSDQGKYAKAVVRPSSDAAPQAECSKKKGLVVVTLRKAAAAKVNCNPASYDIYFLKQGQKNTELTQSRYVKTDLGSKECVFVHRRGIMLTEAYASSGKCLKANDPTYTQTTDKETPIIISSFEPEPLVRGKRFTFKAELKLANGDSLSKQECEGVFSFGGKIVGLNLSPNPNKSENRRVMRFKHQTRTCQYLIKNSITGAVPVQEGRETISFSGNSYLEPAQYSFGFRVINRR